MDNFFVFYALRGVEIVVVVFAVAAVVALIEKALGVDPTPKHIVKLRELQGGQPVRDPLREV